MAGVQGIRDETLLPWLADHVAGFTPPAVFEPIPGGRSNLTYKVTDAAGRAYVLRRPPLYQVLATAHDMGREHRIISALGPTDVPVAAALAYCDDPEVNEAPFYVMSFVDGHVHEDQTAAAAALTLEQRGTAGADLVDVLTRIHAVDPDAVGLGELGRREGYVERQLRRWKRQLDDSKTREFPGLDEVHARLSGAVPEQGPATIVHGDYRLGNLSLDDGGHIVAVFDWELCTLGDPLSDLGWLVVLWGSRGSTMPLEADAGVEGFPSPREIVEEYGKRTGRDVSSIEFYVTFNLWRSACIMEGVYARFVHGAMGEQVSENLEQYKALVDLTAAAALEGAHRL